MDEFKVQTRKLNHKYQTHLTTTNKGQAILIYCGYNIGSGYKKRFLINGKTVYSYDGGK